MRLNCEVINIINSEPYLLGKRIMHGKLASRFSRLWSNKAVILRYLKRKLKYEYYKLNSRKIVDFVVPYKLRKVEDFILGNYEDVGTGVVYTAVFGDYDKIAEPRFVNPRLRYFAFTDTELPLDSVWEKVDVSCHTKLEKLSNYQKAKYIKIFPYEFFEEFKFSIWVDGNVNLVADTYPLAITAKGSPMATFSNPIHNCIYTEASYMVFQGRLGEQEAKKQVSDYRIAGFPEHWGMMEFSIIYRDHADKQCRSLMREWWEHVNEYTMRDQLSLPYVLWKNGKTIDYIKCLGENWRWNPRFRKADHLYQIMYS